MLKAVQPPYSNLNAQGFFDRVLFAFSGTEQEARELCLYCDSGIGMPEATRTPFKIYTSTNGLQYIHLPLKDGGSCVINFYENGEGVFWCSINGLLDNPDNPTERVHLTQGFVQGDDPICKHIELLKNREMYLKDITAALGKLTTEICNPNAELSPQAQEVVNYVKQTLLRFLVGQKKVMVHEAKKLDYKPSFFPAVRTTF